ncbi:unnamed protein product [Symbiodinium natans]|uniref:Uncharacterized protein n=1 Tax=Symbiodinium natans TaxID=878477 RepID=A0A812V6E9_9DINO|nr:unnamed protein product [Symbiodinium natans]
MPALLAVLAMLMPLATAIKFSPDANTSLLEVAPTSNKTDVELALLARSSRASVEEQEKELDAVVSAKALGFIGDAVGGIVDAVGDAAGAVGNHIVTAAEVTANTLKQAGLTIGSAAANAAVIIGKHVIKPAVGKITSLPGDIKNVADTIGNGVIQVGQAMSYAGQLVADSTVQLGGIMADGLKEAGEFVGGVALDMINCIKDSLTPCKLLIGDQCDCDAGSHVTASATSLSIRCVFTKDDDFKGGAGLTAKAGQSFGGGKEGGTAVLPGKEYAQAYKTANQVMKSREALKPKKVKAPEGSCETNLWVAVEGAAQFTPDVTVTVESNGDTSMSISGLVRASIDALVEGEGSCSFHAEKGLPEKPKTKVVCAGKFCIVFMLQFIAELDIKGVLTGTVEASTDIDFEIKGTVKVNPSGKATAHFESPSIKRTNGFAIGASATTSIRFGMGPVFTIYPVPGIPINLNAKINAEAKAHGTLSYRSGMFLIQEDEESHKHLDDVNDFMNATSNELSMCGAAALTTYADIDITGLALPDIFKDVLNREFLVKQIKDGLTKSMTKQATGPASCMPGGDALQNAANSAGNFLASLIPEFDLNFFESIQLLKPQKLFCEEVYKIPNPGFDQAPCAANLGCKFAGRPPRPGVKAPLPSQVTNQVSMTATAPACSLVEGSVKMGDHFIEVGTFRMGVVDHGNGYEYFSIQHKDGVTTQIYGAEGNTHVRRRRPRRDIGTWHRPVGTAKGISFGFQYIQIGNFRLGAIDDNHLSLSHKNGNTMIIYRNDRKVFYGPLTDWGAFDRGEGAPTGVSFGDRFLQIGKFRIGCNDPGHFVVTHTSNTLVHLYRYDGTEHRPGNEWSHAINSRPPAPWTCKDIAEIAYGKCDPDWGAYGDRFIQLGQWRLGAWDANHFSVSHKNGNTAMIYRGDGTRHPGPRRDFGTWNRPTGFPHGISFGPGFIQIGNFRLGAIDDGHLSLAHSNGNVIAIFRHDKTIHSNRDVLRSAWTAWRLTAGAASSITFGKDFLQLGNFRLGDVDGGGHFAVGHNTGGTIQLFSHGGHSHPGIGNEWSAPVFSRFPQWHCGGIQEIMGVCPGLAAGDNFLQIGDWRLGADYHHFTVSHRDGTTAMIYRSDNLHFGGPRSDWGWWGHETKQSAHSLRFGDRFIEFAGAWRLGEWHSGHLSLSHTNGNAPILFRSDGHHFKNFVGHSHGSWHRPRGAAQGVTFGDRFVQIGGFRVGDVDSRHFSITHTNGQTIKIYREDGRHYWGPRTDFTTFGRPLWDCAVV